MTPNSRKIRFLRRHIPEFACLPGCHDCCGPITASSEEMARLPEIARNAIADACTGSNPRQPTQEEMEKLLKCCYYDTEVDF